MMTTPAEYFKWHTDKIERCVDLVNEIGISNNYEYEIEIIGGDDSQFDEGERSKIKNRPWAVRTRTYPFDNQTISFVGTNPGPTDTPDLLSRGAEEGMEKYAQACTEDWEEWLSNGNKAQVYHSVLQVLSDQSKLEIDEK